jgi:Ca-activated chloride channel family protein
MADFCADTSCNCDMASVQGYQAEIKDWRNNYDPEVDKKPISSPKKAGMIALANPQWGIKREKVRSRSADIFLALDISSSMLAEDVVPNRLERGKRFAYHLIDKLKGERIALILFAGNAYLQMPLTNDYSAAKLFLRSAHPGLAGTQGTDLLDPIRVVEENFRSQEESHPAIIVITDGEGHEQLDMDYIGQARNNGMIIFTVGIGTEEGGFIPVRTSQGEDWKRDNTGKPIRTRLDDHTLSVIANAAEGRFFKLNDENAVLQALDEKVENLEKSEYEWRSFTEFESYYQWLLGLALLIFCLEIAISENLLIKK